MSIEDKGVNDIGDGVLWDVIDEHFAELVFCVDRLQRTHEHPLLRLGDLTRRVEARLGAHLNALLLAGPAVALEGTKRNVEKLDPEKPGWATVFGLVSAAAGLDQPLDELFAHGDGRIRLAAARGCSLAASERLGETLLSRLAAAKTPPEAGVWLELMGARNLGPPDTTALVSSAEPDVVVAALRCLRQPVPSLGSVLERLAEHPDPLVRERALCVALAWGTPRAFAICEAQALDEGQASPLAMAAYAILGGPGQHARLAPTAAPKERRVHVLRALGFSGSAGLVPILLEVLESKTPLEAKIAAQAIAAIAGLDLRRDEFSEAPAQGADSLPLLEEDNLDADLVPPPEDALPAPNVAAIRAWWKEREGGLKAAPRLVFGAPRSPDGLLAALEHGPLGLRHGWALAAHLWSGGRFWLDTQALSAVQRSQLALARAGVAQWPSAPRATEGRA